MREGVRDGVRKYTRGCVEVYEQDGGGDRLAERGGGA